ncbi:MAG: hypothetical protein FJY54_12460 [Betaproteobacteria bacterium]|nr:hypothetical protein [Betaproteobacteria bacterium]
MRDNRPLPQTRYGLMRNDVAEVFEIPAVAASGWAVEADLSGWARRCYDIRLRMVRSTGSAWQSQPLARPCLK